MVRCQSIIVQNSSPAPITSTTDNCSTSKLFSLGFSQKKWKPPPKGEGAIDADQTPLLAPHLDGAEKKFVYVCGRMDRCGQQTDKTDAGQLACLSICSRPWFNESVCVVGKACRVKASTWCVGFPSPPHRKRNKFSRSDQNHTFWVLLILSQSFYFLNGQKPWFFSDQTLKNKKK